MTDGGNVPIEQIQAGDLVWAWDVETGDVALKPVVETYANETSELTHVFVDGEEIVATPTHPFYCPTKGWTDAAQLRAGDILVLVNGEYVVVEWVQHELLESPVRVYNFQVADYHTSYVASGLLLRETYTQNGTAYTLDFVYDQSNRPYILNLTTTTGSTTTTTAYYYLLNLQGDVLRLVDASGVTVASYDYDPYGNILTSTGSLANLNPLRYRGYYYDDETGFYYLQSRYYDPAIGRFINADSYASTGQDFLGYNMFAYCNNSPITGYDPGGNMMVYQDLNISTYYPSDALAEMAASHEASAIGAQASVSMDGGKGTISIDLVTYYSQLCAAAEVIGWSQVCDNLAASACRKFTREFGREFILSDECVANEIEAHIYAYQWEIDDRCFPNIIAIGALFKGVNIEEACAFIDMRESDIALTNMQADVFAYRYGIRDCYLNTEWDPYRYVRH